ncbi:hypothetical protein AB4K20DRAFT_1987442 [Rhizopus microsporus]
MDHIIIKTIENEQSFHISKTVTPETVRIKVEYTKNTLKHAYYLANKETMAIKDDLSFMIAIIFLRYHVWKNNFGDDLLMKKADLDSVEASRIVLKYGPKLVKSVALLENH